VQPNKLVSRLFSESVFKLYGLVIAERSLNLPSGTIHKIIELGELQIDFCELILGSEVETLSLRNIADTSRTVRTP
jgi:hypothetical protein